MSPRAGDLVKISARIKNWPDGDLWGSMALVTRVEGMMITLLCNTGNIREIPVQLSPNYLEVIDETPQR